jgi:hypothetical protein
MSFTRSKTYGAFPRTISLQARQEALSCNYPWPLLLSTMSTFRPSWNSSSPETLIHKVRSVPAPKGLMAGSERKLGAVAKYVIGLRRGYMVLAGEGTDWAACCRRGEPANRACCLEHKAVTLLARLQICLLSLNPARNVNGGSSADVDHSGAVGCHPLRWIKPTETATLREHTILCSPFISIVRPQPIPVRSRACPETRLEGLLRPGGGGSRDGLTTGVDFSWTFVRPGKRHADEQKGSNQLQRQHGSHTIPVTKLVIKTTCKKRERRLWIVQAFDCPVSLYNCVHLLRQASNIRLKYTFPLSIPFEQLAIPSRGYELQIS